MAHQGRLCAKAGATTKTAAAANKIDRKSKLLIVGIPLVRAPGVRD
jgi:hypothetical protein